MTEQTETFDQYVDRWDQLCGEIATAKRALKVLTDKEMTMRKAMHDSVRAALGDKFKEGMNNWPLTDGRVLKINCKIDRKIADSELETAKKEYGMLNDVPCTFDELLRIKYELDKKNFNKLTGPAYKAFSRAVITSEQAPEVSLS